MHLDTQLLLWWAIEPSRLTAGTASLLADPAQPLVLSVVSLWEVAIQSSAPSTRWRCSTCPGSTAIPPRYAEDFVFDRLLVVQAQLVAYGEPVQAAG